MMDTFLDMAANSQYLLFPGHTVQTSMFPQQSKQKYAKPKRIGTGDNLVELQQRPTT